MDTFSNHDQLEALVEPIVQALPGPTVTILGLVSTLDNDHINSLEKRLDRIKLDADPRPPVASAAVQTQTVAADSGTSDAALDGLANAKTETAEARPVRPANGTSMIDSEQDKTELAIQSQVQRVAENAPRTNAGLTCNAGTRLPEYT